MVLSREEMLERVRDFAGDRITDDNGIALIEDITDTFDDISAGSKTEIEKMQNDYNELKERYDNLDSDWKQKYLKRFFNNENMNGELIDNNVDTPAGNVTINDLFIRSDKNA